MATKCVVCMCWRVASGILRAETCPCSLRRSLHGPFTTPGSFLNKTLPLWAIYTAMSIVLLLLSWSMCRKAWVNIRAERAATARAKAASDAVAASAAVAGVELVVVDKVSSGDDDDALSPAGQLPKQREPTAGNSTHMGDEFGVPSQDSMTSNDQCAAAGEDDDCAASSTSSASRLAIAGAGPTQCVVAVSDSRSANWAVASQPITGSVSLCSGDELDSDSSALRQKQQPPQMQQKLQSGTSCSPAMSDWWAERAAARQTPLDYVLWQERHQVTGRRLLLLALLTAASALPPMAAALATSCGSWQYYVAVLSGIPLFILIMVALRRMMMHALRVKAAAGLPNSGDILWTPKTTVMIPLMCCVAGRRIGLAWRSSSR